MLEVRLLRKSCILLDVCGSDCPVCAKTAFYPTSSAFSSQITHRSIINNPISPISFPLSFLQSSLVSQLCDNMPFGPTGRFTQSSGVLCSLSSRMAPSSMGKSTQHSAKALCTRFFSGMVCGVAGQESAQLYIFNSRGYSRYATV